MTNKTQTVKVDSITNEISILNEEGRVIFTIGILDGHTIEVRGGNVVKDKGVLYNENLNVIPWSTDVVVVSKMRYE